VTYITPADFRLPSLADYCAGLSLTGNEADDTRLTAAIVRMSDRFDKLTNDHYENADELSLTLDGSGSRIQPLPKRCTSITSVTTKDYAGTSTLQLTSVYRLHSSLNAAGSDWISPYGLDWIEVVPWNYLAMQTGYGVCFPEDPQSVIVVGDFGWKVTPYSVKRAVALLVYDQFKPTAVDRRASAWSSAEANFTRAPEDEDHPTGIPEVDEIVTTYRYAYQTAMVG
jgi:hypothetical protein